MNEIEKKQISVPLNPEAHRFALEFAKEQCDSQKGKKVYLNTLAVYAVHSYLKWLRINSDLTQGDSWNPGLRALFDVADLVLPGIGKLECRRILPDETECVLPIDVTDERIGYVGVKFEEDLKKVYLVGFIPEINSLEPPEQLRIEDFQSIKTLAEKIWYLEEGDLLIQTSQLSPKEALVNLQQWLENIFEPGWQSIESLLSRGSDNLASGVRNAPPKALPFNLSRAKLIEIEGSAQSLVLVVMLLSPQTGSEIDIRVEVHNKNRQADLSPNLLINILNQNGQVEMTAPSKSNVSSIKLEFGVAPGERFSVQLLLGDVEVIENFVM